MGKCGSELYHLNPEHTLDGYMSGAGWKIINEFKHDNGLTYQEATKLHYSK